MGATMKLVHRAIIACIVCADMGVSIFLRVLGPILVIAANGVGCCALAPLSQHHHGGSSTADSDCLSVPHAVLISLVVYMYIWVLLPRYLVHELGRTTAYAALAFGLYLLVNVSVSARSTTIAGPRTP